MLRKQCAHSPDGGGKSLDIPLLNEQTRNAVLNQFGDAAVARAKDSHTCRHGLDERDGDPFLVTIFGRPTPLELEYWQIEKL